MAFDYKIVGTSHVSKESEKRIQKAVDEFHPDLICIELDHQRLQGLLSNQKSKMPPSLIFKIGVGGYLFSLIGSIVQRKLGKKFNIVAGADMLSAVRTAGINNIPIALIDQNIQITLRRLSKSITWKDRWNFAKDFFRGLFTPKKVLAEIGLKKMDLSKIPSEKIIEKTLNLMKKRYPGIYKPLVHERNLFMANRMINIMKKDPERKILAVVGAGHKKGMVKALDQKLLKLEYIKK